MGLEIDFLDALASGEPTPGGGAAAAYAGALASALASMVGSLTMGKPRYADVQEGVAAQLDELGRLRTELLELADADARAFEPIGRAYGMPKDTEEQRQARHEAIQAALADACSVPIDCMRACLRVIDAADYLAAHGNRTALTDAAAAAVLAKAALQAASLNVYANAAAMDDRSQASAYVGHSDFMSKVGVERADAVYNAVAEGLGAPKVDEFLRLRPRNEGEA